MRPASVDFTELLASAIANAESRAELSKLVEEQTALRRVATLVAHGVASQEMFATVTEEVGQLLPVEFAIMGRYEPDDAVTAVAAWSRTGNPWPPVGSRWHLEGKNLMTIVFETGRPARIDSYADASGAVGVNAREHDFRSTVGAPIVVEGRLWGAIAVGSTSASSPAARYGGAARLIHRAAGDLDRQRREPCRAGPGGRGAGGARSGRDPGRPWSGAGGAVRCGDQGGRAAPWRVPRGHGPLQGRRDGNCLDCVGSRRRGAPVGRGAVAARRWRCGLDRLPDGHIGPDRRLPGTSRANRCVRPGRARDRLVSRQPDRRRRAPVGRSLSPRQADAPAVHPRCRSRLADFTELVAAAIANAESRTELAQLAVEQAALGRVATLVARGVPPEEVFAAVTEEVGHLLFVEYAGLGRFEPDGTVAFVASWGRAVDFVPVGSRWRVGGKDISTLVFETGRPARIDSYAEIFGSLSVAASETGVRSSVGTPVIVEGLLWGVMGVASSGEQPLPTDTEARLAKFTELLATSIANAESRAELDTSACDVAAGDEMRRRIERDLHDGAQQQLVSLMLELRKAEATEPCEECGLHAYLARTGQALADVLDGLQEISRGVHPAILSKGGLGPALKALSRRSAIPVELEVRAERRLPEHIEVAAYYVASEALANAAKHASASVVTIEVDVGDPMLRLEIRDDGIGGADPRLGSGLVGLADRIEALGGRFVLTSQAGGGTSMLMTVPIEMTASHEPQEPNLAV